MSYTAPYIDAAGLHIPSYTDIRDDLVETFKSIYGQDIYLDNDSQDYQMISAFALKTYDTMQLLQIVYNNHSPKTAVGTGLDSLVKLNGIRRKEASYSTCVLTITGTVGTEIAAGIVQDESGLLWDLPTGIILSREEEEVTAQCETLGAIEAPPGTITKIQNPQRGWVSVTNKVAAVPGDPVETDEDLRARQTISVSIPSRNLLNGTIAGISSVDGVTRYKVYDNDTNVTDANGVPGHSIAAVVEGGLDKDIAEQIYLRKGPGGGTYGTTEYEFTNLDGGKTMIHFFRPDYVTVDVTVAITKGLRYTSTVADQIKTAVTDYLESLTIGDCVSITGALAAITAVIPNRAQPIYSLKSLTIGKAGEILGTADVTIPFNAVVKTGTITVEVM
ncbi:baseplate J/gp47 family protein [uncultured Acidaminococcus sp.]|uniref:baseplate J/gp47 family protein n=1 Tax=uncultured Acidaminococcus sp. TaxID=352152 RepID=UPI002599ABA2|nr:baseplate J/gp47 family protein [uncultured Acidaminococcus sp.]